MYFYLSNLILYWLRKLQCITETEISIHDIIGYFKQNILLNIV